MTHNIFWWNCKHIEVDNNLGVAFCTKNNDFCNKSKCTEIQVNPKKQYYRERMEELQNENEQLKSTNMEMEDYLGRLEESNINLQIKLQKIRDYAKEDGEVKQGIIEKVILND